MNAQDHNSPQQRPHTDAPAPFRLSDTCERKREEVRETLHHAISRRVFARRAAHASLAALTLLGLTWLAARTSFVPTPTAPASVPIARSTPLQPTPSSSPTFVQRHETRATTTIAIVRDDPGIIARLSVKTPTSRIEPLDDNQLLAELRPIRGDVGLVRVAGRIEIVDAASTLRPSRRPTYNEHGREQGNAPSNASAATRARTIATTTTVGMPCL